jgi:hypothetical protein
MLKVRVQTDNASNFPDTISSFNIVTTCAIFITQIQPTCEGVLVHDMKVY